MVFLTETISIKSHLKKLDKVIVSIITALIVIAVLDLNQLTESIRFIGEALKGIFIFLLASVLLASFAKATGLDQQISMVFSGHPFKAIIVASLFGALSPFCSCGVVPIIAGLLMAGVPLAPVMAFCFASPLMDPSMFLLMVPVFGLEFTLAKLIFAIIIAITAGLSLHYFRDHPLLSSPLRDLRATCCTSSCSSTTMIENKVIKKTAENVIDEIKSEFHAELEPGQVLIGPYTVKTEEHERSRLMSVNDASVALANAGYGRNEVAKILSKITVRSTARQFLVKRQ